MNPHWLNHHATRVLYDRLAGWYDFLAGTSEQHVRQRGIDILGIRAGEKVLELGCGTGLALAGLGKQAKQAVGVDLSLKMLQAAQRKGICHLVQADFLLLPYPSESFEAAFLCFSLETLPEGETQAALQEIQRVLKENGRICLVNIARVPARGAIPRLYLAAHQRFPHVVDCRPLDASAELVKAGYTILREDLSRVWSIPVEIVMAVK
ncbi:MAG TPA: methyltransferase domain-containing protein [Anaerolineaceae bacterium]